LGGIQLDNKGRTDPHWIEQLLPWKPGDVYRPAYLAGIENRLLDTKIYDAVTVALKPEPAPDGTRSVLVAVADRSRHSIELGGGYSTAEGYDADLRWSTYNQFHRADTVTAELKYGGINSRLGVDLTLPHWSRPGTTLIGTAELFQNLTDAYDEAGEAVRVDLTRRRSPTSYAYFTRGVSLTRSDITDKHIGKVHQVSLGFLGAIAVDRSDSPLDPKRGWRFEARAEPTVTTGDETLAYLKTTTQASFYLPLDGDADTVVAARAKLGAIMGGKIPSLPAGARFYAGGGGSIRGYSYQGVGPRYSDNVPIGGLSLFETGLEVRQRLRRNFGLVGFVDAGSVGQAVNPDFNNLQYSVGVGLRYDLGFAPFRADVAFPIDRPKGDSTFQIYLSIGQSF
jgi:translocation and assembly module TamA